MLESTTATIGYTASPFYGHPHLERLRRVSIFSHLGDAMLLQLARVTTAKRWSAGSLVAGEQDTLSGLYVITQGRAKTVLFGENGREMTLSTLGPGDFCGEAALLEERPLRSNLLAMEDLTVLIVERSAFLRVLQQSPQAAMQLLRRMAGRLRRADELVGNLALRDVGARLCHVLVGLGQEGGEATEDGILLKRRPTQQDLANMVGTCRETVSRLLSVMARDGLIVSRGRTLLLTAGLLESQRRAA